jgi:hypothetical protein
MISGINMSKNIEKTIEELSYVATPQDLWKELHQELNTRLLYIDNSPVTVRFLGPFVGASRFYCDYRKYFSAINGGGPRIDDVKIANRDRDEIEKLKGFLRNKMNPHKKNRSFSSLTSDDTPTEDYINKIGNSIWQKCIMVNTYQRKSNDIKVLPLTKTLCKAITNAFITSKTHNKKGQKIIVSGVMGSDITISKRGGNNRSQTVYQPASFNITLSKPNSLSYTELEFIASNGLVDLPTLVNNLNKPTSTYIYRLDSGYKMASEFVDALLAEGKGIEENQHLNNVENHINEIPREAFDNSNDIGGSIGLIDL